MKYLIYLFIVIVSIIILYKFFTLWDILNIPIFIYVVPFILIFIYGVYRRIVIQENRKWKDPICGTKKRYY